jgi:non-ribosomal peptide synthetase component F
VPGDLYIGGVQVARGYFGHPGMTARSFIPDPLSATPGGRLYRTGDLARFLSDGQIEFLGRADQQVKIRGFRVETGEVEAALGEHPSVAEVAVIVTGNQRGESSLAAYVVAKPDQRPTASELRAFLRSKLPDYMLPSTFVAIDTLPLTPSGKVDRQHLPSPKHARLEASRAFVAPRSQIEEVIAAVFAEVLESERISVNDNFFELGGHSLLATRVVSRLRDRLEVELPLRLLFESPVVADLARNIEEAMRVQKGLQIPPLVRVPRDRDLPLSFAQQRLWFVNQLAPESPFYNFPAAVRLKGALDVTALEKTINEIVSRHETLRTTFITKYGQPVQVISPSMPRRLPVVDLSGLPEAEREEEALRLAAHEARQAFNLSTGPLLRASLLQLGPDEHIALFTMHHIVSDGWSVGVIIRELAALYEAFSEGKESPLPELPVQYADFAVWQRQWLKGDLLEAQLSDWRQRLAGAPLTSELPTDRPRPLIQSYRGATEAFELSEDLSDELRALSHQEGGTLFMALLAAYEVLFYRYTGQTDVVIGSGIANRNRIEIEGLIGFFVNPLVMRTDLTGNPSFRELLGRVREVALGAYAHQDLPFERLVEELHLEPDLSRTPVFQVTFFLQNSPMDTMELPGLILSKLDVGTGTTHFDVTLSISDTGQALSGMVEYNTDLFDASTIRQMLGHYAAILKQVAARPELRLLEVDLVEGEHHQHFAADHAPGTSDENEQFDFQVHGS